MSSETRTRIITAFTLIPVVIAGLYYGGWAWALLVTLIGLQSLHEFYTMMEAKGFSPLRREGLISAFVLFGTAYALDAEAAMFVLTVSWLGITFGQLLRKTADTAITNMAVTLSGILYVPWLLANGIYMRRFELDGVDIGGFLIFLSLATTFAGDTGGYFAGRKFGKHKISPAISPKKSWEGLVGGIVFSMLVGTVAIYAANAFWTDTRLPIWFGVILGICNSTLGLAGDLVESMIKRDAEVKDSGTILPGHGGFLDRIDAVLFTIAFNYHLFRYFYNHPDLLSHWF